MGAISTAKTCTSTAHYWCQHSSFLVGNTHVDLFCSIAYYRFMADYHTTDNFSRPFSSVRLVYETDPSFSETHWSDNLDRVTRLVMQVKEDELLSGFSVMDMQELVEMEEVGFLSFEEDEDLEEE